MRKLIVAAGVLVVVGGVLLIIATVSLNRIVGANRDRILQRARAAIGRDLGVDRMTVSLRGGLGVRLEQVTIADDPLFSATEFLHAGAITARVRLWPLLRGRLEVAGIDALRPHVELIRDDAGRWNYATLHAQSRAQSAHGFETVSATTTASETLPLFLASANIADGTIVVTDRTQTPARTTKVTRIALAMSDVSETTPVRFDLVAALESASPNVHLHGRAGPLANRAGIPIEVTGNLGPFGSRNSLIGALQAKALATAEHLEVSQFDGKACGGSFNFTGQYPLRRDGQLTFKGQIRDVAMVEVMELTAADVAKRVAGTGQLGVDLRAHGNSAEEMRSSLSGTVTAEVRGGAVKGFNIVNDVLGQATGLPQIGSLISANVKPKYGRLFSQPDTRFESLRGTFTIGGQRVRTDDLAVIATDYGVRAAGWIGFDRETDLAGTLMMSRRFTDDVIADVKEVKYVVGNDGQLAVPFRLRGKLGEAKPQPDTDRLITLLTRALARGSVGDLVEKLLGTKRPTPGNTGGAQADKLEQRLRDLLGR